MSEVYPTSPPYLIQSSSYERQRPRLGLFNQRLASIQQSRDYGVVGGGNERIDDLLETDQLYYFHVLGIESSEVNDVGEKDPSDCDSLIAQ